MMSRRLLPLGCLGLFLMAGTLLPAPPDPASELPLGKGVRCVVFSPDGTRLAATFGEPKQRGRVVLWHVPSKKLLWSHSEAVGVPAVAFAPDGKTLAVGSYDNTARLLDTATGQVLKVLQGHSNFVRAVAFSPDGKTLATGGWDHKVKLWNLADGTVRRTLEWPADQLFALNFSPGGQWLLASQEQLRLWDAATGKVVQAFDGQKAYVEWALFADDHWFLSADNHGTVRLWSVAKGEQRLRFQSRGAAYRLALSRAARRFAAVNYFSRAIDLFEFTLEEPTAAQKERLAELLTKLDDDDYDVREAAGKEILALGLVVEPILKRTMDTSSSAEVRIRCRRLREVMLSKPRAILSGHTDDVESLAFSGDGRLLASGGRDGMVRLWQVQEGKEWARLMTAD